MTGPIVLALSVSFIAGLCAYVITLEEAEHHFPSRRRQQMEALRTGFVAMLFFILLAVALAFVFSRMFGAESGRSSTGNQLGACAELSREAWTRIDPAPSRVSPITAAAWPAELIWVPGEEVQGQERRAAHGVDVADRVGGGDAAPGGRVVDHRGDEVGRHDERRVVVEAPDGGVVAGVEAHQELRMGVAGQVAQDLRQLARSELAGSAGAVTELRQATGRACGHHR